MINVNDSLEKKLRDYLQLYWLRPENALLTTFKSKAIEDYSFSSPALDISCGDGLFMFLHLGGKFEFNFDYFKNTSAKEFSHEQFIDIYDSFDGSSPGNLIETVSGSSFMGGWHTVQIDSMEIESDQDFFIGIKFYWFNILK